MAFQKWFGTINEIQSIAGKVPMLAVTATATTNITLKIIRSLEMKKPALLVESPNRQNISYAVKVGTPTKLSSNGERAEGTAREVHANHYSLLKHQGHSNPLWIFLSKTWK